MPKHDLSDLLTAAQTRVCAARTLLTQPRTCNIEECTTLFREAQGYLEWLRDRLAAAAPAGQDLRRQAALLAGEIRQAAVLIDNAARYGRQWLGRLRSPEYNHSGGPVPLPIRGQISYLG